MACPSKRGLCVPWNFDPKDFALYQAAIDKGTISWLSNWEMWKPKGLPSNITYTPQCRTGNEANQIQDYLRGYENDSQVDGFLGFNEPDITSQANLSVEKAVELWRLHVLPLKEKYPAMKIGSPAVSNGPNGLPWLRQFFDAQGGVRSAGVDFIVLHYYGPDVEHFKHYVAQSHQTFGVPISVTEFACTRWDPKAQCSEQEVCSFMKGATEFLDNSSFIERYAWFGSMADVGEAVGTANCLQNGGTLSPAGLLYCS